MELDAPLPRIEPVRSTADLSVGCVETAEVRLSGLPRGAALLLCARGGLDSQAGELMNALAEHGYETLATDLSWLDLNDAGRLAAVEGLLDVLATRGWTREQVGVVGYADGGRAALIAAGATGVGAAVSLSPSGWDDSDPPVVNTPWLGLFGERDEACSPEDVADLGRRLADAPAFSRVVVYPGADADFFRGPADALGHAAAFDSWQRVVEWLNVRVAPRPSPYAELWSLRLQQHPSHPSHQS